MRSLCVMCSLYGEKCVSDFIKRIILIRLRIRKEEERKRESDSERVRVSAFVTLRHDVTFMRAVTMMYKQSTVFPCSLYAVIYNN